MVSTLIRLTCVHIEHMYPIYMVHLLMFFVRSVYGVPLHDYLIHVLRSRMSSNKALGSSSNYEPLDIVENLNKISKENVKTRRLIMIDKQDTHMHVRIRFV